jgi:hypothetical protein
MLGQRSSLTRAGVEHRPLDDKEDDSIGQLTVARVLKLQNRSQKNADGLVATLLQFQDPYWMAAIDWIQQMMATCRHVTVRLHGVA